MEHRGKGLLQLGQLFIYFGKDEYCEGCCGEGVVTFSRFSEGLAERP